MKYVRTKSGDIDIMEDGDSIPAGSETIFSTDPSVYEGTWETENIHTKRADVVLSEEGKSTVIEGGTIKPEEQKRLEGHMRGGKKADRPFWTEPHKAHPTEKICVNCGKKFTGRPNQKFCCERCKNTYGVRQRRAQTKVIKTFKPHTGKDGQIYYILDGKIEFVPALWCDTYKRAEKYIKERYEGKELVEILKQIRGVMGK